MPRRWQAGCQMTPYVTNRYPIAFYRPIIRTVPGFDNAKVWSSKRRETCFLNAEQGEIEKYQTCDYPFYLLLP